MRDRAPSGDRKLSPNPADFGPPLAAPPAAPPAAALAAAIAAALIMVLITALAPAFALAAEPLAARHRPPASGPARITLLAQIQDPSWAWGSEAFLCVDGDHLYIPLGYPGLAIYDISSPAAPVRLAQVHSQTLGGQAGAVAARGSRAYLALPDKSELAVMDVTDPARPTILTRVTGAPDVQQLHIRGSFLYAYCGSRIGQAGGVYAYDISGAAPVEAGRFTGGLIDPGFFMNEGGIAFLARTPATAVDSAKIDVVDMRRPAAPATLGRWTSAYPGNITDMDLKKGRLYCSAYWGGIWVLDAADASSLKLAASFDWEAVASTAKSIKASPPYIFLAQGGPEAADQKFAVFEDLGSAVGLRQEIAASAFTHSVALSGDLLFLVEEESPWDSSNPQKTVRLYRVEAALKPPVQVALRRDINRSLFFQEAYHTISWLPNVENAGAGLAAYRVYRKPAGAADDAYLPLGTVTAEVLRYVDGRLPVSADYEYAVTAVDGEGVESAFSLPVKN